MNCLRTKLLSGELVKEKNHYIIGGGYDKNDGLFSFKKDFAPKWYISILCRGKRFITEEIYDKLVISSGEEVLEDSSFFPLYRKGMFSEII